MFPDVQISKPTIFISEFFGNGVIIFILCPSIHWNGVNQIEEDLLACLQMQEKKIQRNLCAERLQMLYERARPLHS